VTFSFAPRILTRCGGMQRGECLLIVHSWRGMACSTACRMAPESISTGTERVEASRGTGTGSWARGGAFTGLGWEQPVASPARQRTRTAWRGIWDDRDAVLSVPLCLNCATNPPVPTACNVDYRRTPETMFRSIRLRCGRGVRPAPFPRRRCYDAAPSTPSPLCLRHPVLHRHIAFPAYPDPGKYRAGASCGASARCR